MEVSNVEETYGRELVDTLASLTGLPEPWVSQELVQLIEKSGKNEKEITLEQLRDAMLIYLETVQADLIQKKD